MHDPKYFMHSPHIVIRANEYCLRWRYGDFGWFFQPQSKVINGQLVFSVQATASSGDFTGKYTELLITDQQKIRALETGGAMWWEPNGKKVPLPIWRL